MNILFINYGIHHKNRNALQKYKNINFDTVDSMDNIDFSKYNIIYSPSEPINVLDHPNKKFIFGPHFSTFPNYKITNIIGPNTVYIQPSEWAANIWKQVEICKQFKIDVLPFGVDTDKFCETVSISSRSKVFIYFKNRNPLELRYLEHLLTSQNIEYKVFDYKARYSEEDYVNYLKQSKFGIWLGCHESQGFALQEALSCNVPLFVWSVKTMSQEHGCNYPAFEATSIPYWDDRCGDFLYDINNFFPCFKKFILNIESYRPREYILENLSIDVCEKKFIDICNSFT
jgi:glycosyltransferase involved in cell wall biosynthesis